MSALSRAIADGKLDKRFYIVGDDAFKVAEQILTPYPGENLPPPECAFNFWQSNSRITIECAFGMLVRKWPVLQAPLQVKLDNMKKVVLPCMILHNLCVEDRKAGGVARSDAPPAFHHERTTTISHVLKYCDDTKAMYPTSFVLAREHREKQPGRRTDLEQSKRREEVRDWTFQEGQARGTLRDWLNVAGLVRPGRRSFK